MHQRNNFLSQICLYFIFFSNCCDNNFLNPKKSRNLLNKCLKNFTTEISSIIFNNNNNNHNLNKFLKDYDLIHSCDYFYDLNYFFINGKFFNWKIQIDDNAQSNNKTLRKEINAVFYEGFDN